MGKKKFKSKIFYKLPYMRIEENFIHVSVVEISRLLRQYSSLEYKLDLEGSGSNQSLVI